MGVKWYIVMESATFNLVPYAEKERGREEERREERSGKEENKKG